MPTTHYPQGRSNFNWNSDISIAGLNPSAPRQTIPFVHSEDDPANILMAPPESMLYVAKSITWAPTQLDVSWEIHDKSTDNYVYVVPRDSRLLTLSMDGLNPNGGTMHPSHLHSFVAKLKDGEHAPFLIELVDEASALRILNMGDSKVLPVDWMIKRGIWNVIIDAFGKCRGIDLFEGGNKKALTTASMYSKISREICKTVLHMQKENGAFANTLGRDEDPRYRNIWNTPVHCLRLMGLVYFHKLSAYVPILGYMPLDTYPTVDAVRGLYVSLNT